ncbi:MAG: winged helix-turn-helix domain-containing protein [Xenococcaceae cyanobacterium MO_188.B29]|nr:winged helix-turn-helix domain-containing protein [Xenococcaceae cyanobacterium MO_188.B29]
MIVVIAVTKIIVEMIKRFRSWLANYRHFLLSWYTKDSQATQEPEKSLVELPSELREKLVNRVQNLPDHPTEKEAIVSALNENFTRWCDNPNNTNNSIVILSSPVATASRILTKTLQQWSEEKQIKIELLEITARPTNIETIKSKLEHYIQPKALEDDSEKEELEILVIPNLSWCFLRSLEGLAGIEYVQSLLCDGSKNRFWIIGAGQVGWQYLNLICNIEAYCGRVLTLPKIESEQLQEWFEPIIEEFDIVFDDPSFEQKFLDKDKDNKTKYFDRLAGISQGVSIIAIQIFLGSIGYKKIDDNEDKDDTNESSQPESKQPIAKMPSLPGLPPLEPDDQFILYSLILHGDLTISALAESLGDEQSEVQARVQILRRQGVIEQKDKVLKINPIHYPALKQELANNNFIIHRE